MTCAALDWNREQKDYIECSKSGVVQMVQLSGIISIRLLLCDAHREMFEEELAAYGGRLDEAKRVQIVVF